MGSPVPKQFLEISGKSVLMHTLEAFYRYDEKIQIIVVLPDAETEHWNSLIIKHNFSVPHTICAGGEERFFSVKNGLQTVENAVELIAVHDGVRPLVSQKVIAGAFDSSEKHGAAVPVIPLSDSIRKISGDTSQTQDRKDFCLVQTPQCFKAEILKIAYQQPYQENFTDDASVVEAAGYSVSLSEGARENIKITTSADLIFAEALRADLPA
jgi:2-C-methyl-D-erythritol 4-phosphate cytidylyltransferase